MTPPTTTTPPGTSRPGAVVVGACPTDWQPRECSGGCVVAACPILRTCAAVVAGGFPCAACETRHRYAARGVTVAQAVAARRRATRRPRTTHDDPRAMRALASRVRAVLDHAERKAADAPPDLADAYARHVLPDLRAAVAAHDAAADLAADVAAATAPDVGALADALAAAALARDGLAVRTAPDHDDGGPPELARATRTVAPTRAPSRPGQVAA